jgi:hypothetical protein
MRLTALLSVVGACALLVPSSAQSASDYAGADVGAFHADCTYSHRKMDDAIVFPRIPGASHPHDFFGNVSADAYSTNSSLRKAATNCVRTNSRDPGMDHSAYWAPAVYVGDLPVQPTALGAYYKAGPRNPSDIEPFPEDLRIIAGDALAKTPAEVNGRRVYTWECEGATLASGSDTVAPTCSGNLVVTIKFPDCWDGVHLDSRNHKSHMAYARREAAGAQLTCPADHPVLVPALELKIRYPIPGGPLVRLASGPIASSHADFMNGWDQSKLQALVRNCLNVDEYCGGGDAPVPGHAGNGNPLPASSISGGEAPRFRRAAKPGVSGTRKQLHVDTGWDTSCPAGGAACRVAVEAAAGKLNAGVGRAAMPAGDTRRLEFTLSPQAARQLMKAGRLRLKLRLQANAGPGPSRSQRRTLVINAPRRSALKPVRSAHFDEAPPLLLCSSHVQPEN